MKVRIAIPEHRSSSYGGKRVYNGDVIDIDPNHFSERWMEKIKSKPGPKAKRPKLSINREKRGK